MIIPAALVLTWLESSPALAEGTVPAVNDKVPA